MESNEDSCLELFSEIFSKRRRALTFVWTSGSWRSFVFEIRPLFPDFIARTVYTLYLMIV